MGGQIVGPKYTYTGVRGIELGDFTKKGILNEWKVPATKYKKLKDVFAENDWGAELQGLLTTQYPGYEIWRYQDDYVYLDNKVYPAVWYFPLSRSWSYNPARWEVEYFPIEIRKNPRPEDDPLRKAQMELEAAEKARDVAQIQGQAAKAQAEAQAAQQGAAGAGMPTVAAIELSVNDDFIWTARTAGESASNDPDNPHPGISIAGPGMWERYSGGMTPSQAGLPRPILTFNAATGLIGPATTEYSTVKAAAEKGDPGAQSAMQSLGLRFTQRQQPNPFPFPFPWGF